MAYIWPFFSFFQNIYISLRCRFCSAFPTSWFHPFPPIAVGLLVPQFLSHILLKHCLHYYIFLNSIIFTCVKLWTHSCLHLTLSLVESIFNDAVFNYKRRDSAIRNFCGSHVLFASGWGFHVHVPSFFVLHFFFFFFAPVHFFPSEPLFSAFFALGFGTLKTLALFPDGCVGQMVTENASVLFPWPSLRGKRLGCLGHTVWGVVWTFYHQVALQVTRFLLLYLED